MTLPEWLYPPPTMFRSDSRSVEAVTGWFIAYTGVSCWLAEWFTYFMPNSSVAGHEWMAAVLLIPVGVVHAVKAHSYNLRRRASQAYWAAGIFAALAVVLATNHAAGWRTPGAGYALLGSVVQGWCYLRLRSVIT